eukprot:TRINITY_DN434_c0_g1_i10.p1 TRINITY_DN434_c0_g1~~TRINITY_DN434_c0_g1_i10.p1  ORF type:complete len:609 (+),score=86.48 TRINITY_DN434_c0_g1_i10:912-2738(+)
MTDLKILLFFIALLQNILVAQSVCPQDCPDKEPPRQPLSCKEIADDGLCGGRFTGGDRYCQCSCKTCAALLGLVPSPSPPPVSPKSGWFNIATTKSSIKSVSSPKPVAVVQPKPAPLPIAAVASTRVMGIAQQQISSGQVTEIGLAVGGSRGIDTFRRNIEEGKMPEISDITYEGIFNDYFFDISNAKPCTELFCAKYSGAVSFDPFFNSKELYIAVGLETGLKLKDFKRKDLDLVIVLDVSGSMTSKFGDFDGITAAEKKLKKIDVAKQAIKDVLQHLTTKDKLAIVTFEKTAKTVLSLRTMDSSGKSAAISAINRIKATGLTNLEAGLNTAVNQFQKDSRQNRVIVITDANANVGEYSPSGLAQIVGGYANRADPIYTSLIGVGLDFNTALTDRMLQTRGANYFSVYSPKELRSKLNEEFDFMVTPLVYDLQIEIEKSSLTGDNGWEIAKAYGVPSKDGGVAGSILSVNTLFPSPKTSAGIKGGIILLQMKRRGASSNPLYIKVSYKDPDFNEYRGMDQITLFSTLSEEFYGTNAIRKAIFLARYVDVLSFWILDVAPSDKLVVPKQSADDFVILLNELLQQNAIIKDWDLDREDKILRKLILPIP